MKSKWNLAITAAVLLTTQTLGATELPAPPGMGSSPEQQPDPATVKMVAKLAAIAAETKVTPSFRENSIAAAQLLQVEKEGKRKGPALDFEIAREYLRAGMSAEALPRLEKLRAALEKNPEAVKADVLEIRNGTSLPEDMLYGLEHTKDGGKSFEISDFLKEIRFMIAVTHLRIGEQQNCIARHGPDSCLFPIQGSGVHTRQEGSRGAIKELEKLLEQYPDDYSARWLLNLAYMTVGEYPQKVPAKWLVPSGAIDTGKGSRRFPDIASRAGVAVNGRAGGALLEDFDSDGRLDLMVCGLGVHEQMQYFHNKGDGTFVDKTREAGLTGMLGGANMVQADFDNDGDLDVWLMRGVGRGVRGHHPASLLKNDGAGRFTDATEEAGLYQEDTVLVSAWGDYDNDGWVDLYVGNESLCRGHRHPSKLYHNDRNGRFTSVPECAGARMDTYVRATQWGDYDGDGNLDLFVACEGDSNRLFRNKGAAGNWTFEDVTAKAGVEAPICNFPAWFWDFDGDGKLDIFVGGYGPKIQNLGGQANQKNYALIRRYLYSYRNESSDMAGETLRDYLGLPTASEVNYLYRNKGDGTFENVAEQTGLAHVTFSMSGNYGDLNNDGWLDFYVGTGGQGFSTLIPNRLYLNEGGKRFREVTTAAGMGHLQKGHAIAIGDVDNDGDQDIYIKMGGTFEGDVAISALYQNPGADGHWVRLRLEGTKSNRAALGAHIVVEAEGPAGLRKHHAWVTSGGSFGTNSLEQFIGLGQAKSIRSVEVVWPGSDRKPQVFTGVELDRAYKLREGEAKAIEVATPLCAAPKPAAP